MTTTDFKLELLFSHVYFIWLYYVVLYEMNPIQY